MKGAKHMATMRFTQGIKFKCSDPDAFIKLFRQYDAERASADVAGFIGGRLLADRDVPGQFLMIAEFAEVDGELTAAQEAERNNARNEAEGWLAKLLEVIDGEPEYFNYDELYRTGITGNIRTG